MNDTTARPAPPKQLLETQMQQPAYWWNHWDIETPAGHTIDDVLKPEYWAHNSRRLRPNDRLDVVAADKSFRVDLWVVAIQGHAVYVRVMSAWTEDAAAALDAPPAPTDDRGRELPRVEWGGPAHKHRVIGLAGEVVSHGFETRELAADEMARLFPGRRRAA